MHIFWQRTLRDASPFKKTSGAAAGGSTTMAQCGMPHKQKVDMFVLLLTGSSMSSTAWAQLCSFLCAAQVPAPQSASWPINCRLNL